MMEDVGKWFSAFIRPADFLKRKKATTWGEAFQQVIESGFLSGIILGFFVMVLMGIGISLSALHLPMSNLSLLGASGWLLGFGLWMLYIFAMPIYSAVLWFLGTIPLYASARLFGGKADFEPHLTNLAWLFAPVMFILSWIIWIPIAGFILAILLGIYSLYPLTVIIKDTHKMSTGLAICAWLFWVVIFILAAVSLGSVVSSGLSLMHPVI